MEQIVYQSVGIDVSKATISACVCQQDSKQHIRFSDTETFENTKTGFNRLLKRAGKLLSKEVRNCYVMEATGVYHEVLAHHLHKMDKEVCVVLPNKVKNYARSLNIKTKTDKVDARIIAQLGVERRLDIWSPPLPVFTELRQLTRLYEQIIHQKTQMENIKHSKEFMQAHFTFVTKTTQRLVESYDDQKEKVSQHIKQFLKKYTWLNEKVNKICTIKGIGKITAAIIIAETNGFEQFLNRKQLVSYAGYDVVERQSGTTVKGKTKISKKGNSHIRRALYFPAMVAARHNESLFAFYERVNVGKPSKMVGNVAVQRKLLCLIYTLWKNDEIFCHKKFLQKIDTGNHEPVSSFGIVQILQKKVVQLETALHKIDNGTTNRRMSSFGSVKIKKRK